MLLKIIIVFQWNEYENNTDMIWIVKIFTILCSYYNRWYNTKDMSKNDNFFLNK